MHGACLLSGSTMLHPYRRRLAKGFQRFLHLFEGY